MDNFKDVGNLTKDPELRYTKDGTPVCTFAIASNTGFSEGPDYYDCVTWRTQAENAGNFLKKGRSVLVSGRLKIESYEDKDGVKRKGHKIDNCTVKYLGKKDE